MSDDISIPRETLLGTGTGPGSFSRSYRTRRPGMDRTTKGMLLVAGALTVALVGGMGVWALRTPRPPGVPVIEADSRPLRIKPEDTGTASVLADPAGVSDEGPGDLAPAAERPDPQALRAQLQATEPAGGEASGAAPAVPATAVPAAGAPGGGAPAGAVPAGAVPAAGGAGVPAGAAAAPVASVPAVAAPVTAPVAGGQAVQLAAVGSEAAAATEWARLQKKAPELLGARKPVVQRAVVDGKAVWRVRTAGFADLAEATQFCRKVREKGLGCSLATF